MSVCGLAKTRFHRDLIVLYFILFISRSEPAVMASFSGTDGEGRVSPEQPTQIDHFA